MINISENSTPRTALKHTHTGRGAGRGAGRMGVGEKITSDFSCAVPQLSERSLIMEDGFESSGLKVSC